MLLFLACWHAVVADGCTGFAVLLWVVVGVLLKVITGLTVMLVILLSTKKAKLQYCSNFRHLCKNPEK